MENQIRCAICDKSVVIGAGYLLRIDVMADPEVPDLTTELIESADLNATMAQVIEEAKHLTAEDLQDGVHRRFEFRLCPGCQRRFIANPLGLPRQTPIGNN